VPYDLTIDLVSRMVESGLIPPTGPTGLSPRGVPGRRILAHTEPRVVDGKGEYARVETVCPGQSLPLVLDGQEVALIPFDELLR
jgi:hypothetical protein